MRLVYRNIARKIEFIILVASLLGIYLLEGCAQLQKLKGIKVGKHVETAQVINVSTVSRLNSLTRAQLQVDTLVFMPRKEAEQNVEFNYYKLKDEAALEVKGLPPLTGFRVQVASSDNRKDLDRLVARVEREFEAKSHIDQYDGKWCLRVGDCRKREDAERMRERAVEFGFKYAWVVQVDLPPGLE